MTDKLDLSAVTEPVTEDELLAVLLDMTGDLDKARVLRKTLPTWLVEAKPATLAALEQAHRDSEQPRKQVKALLSRLQPLHQFCVERLHTFLLSKGVASVDVERDQLEVITRQVTGLMPPLSGPLIEAVTWEKTSLVQAAMHNFDAAKARSGGIAAGTVVRSAATRKEVAGLSAAQFVDYCRELDLGETYQRHIRQVFDLPAPWGAPAQSGLGYNAASVQMGRAKLLDMQIDLHIACAQGHVNEALGKRLLKLIKADRPANDLAYLSPLEKPLIWQGMNIDDACLWGVLVVCDDEPGQLGGGTILVYMPNEPVRPWYEYETLEDFKRYLTLKLQVTSYRTAFARYLDEHERVGFFQRFDKGRTLGQLEPVPVTSNFSEFFFNAFTGKLQRDALALAVPTAQVDEDADQARWQAYFDAGLDLLNVASFVVPVLGELMLGVAVGQLLGEVFDGVEDWLHDDNAEALGHLVNIGESLAAMVAFAAAGRVVGTLKARVTSAGFFDKVEAIARSDHRPALWRPRLAPYRQTLPIGTPWATNSKGICQAKGQSWIKIDGSVYSIGYDPGMGQWRINHPTRAQAYRPALRHNNRGGWQHAFEQPEQWRDQIYALTRLDPELEALLPKDTRAIAAISDTSHTQAQRLAMEQGALTQRFEDMWVRFRQHQKVARLIGQLELGETPTADTARTQMLAIPMMSGWPKGRFIELLDDEDYLLESYPDVSPFDYEDLSVHLTQRQLQEGQVMETVLQALTAEERKGLLGETVALDKAAAVFQRRLLATLKNRRQSLTQKLYEEQEGDAQGALVVFKNAYPQLSNRVAWELLSQATDSQRRALDLTGRLPLSLAERASGALARQREDIAIAGLYWPEQAVPDTRRLALGVLRELPGWPRDLFMQLREGSVRGEVLDAMGDPLASLRRTLVQTADGFQAFDETSQSLDTVAGGSLGFYQALVDALPQRSRIPLDLLEARASQRLLSRIRQHTQEHRPRVAAYLRGEVEDIEAPALSCVQAAPAGAGATEPALLRKVRKLYPRLDDSELANIIQDAGVDHLSRAKAIEALQQQFETLHRTLKIWRSDRATYKSQGSPLWGYRLSRHQVLKTIEQGWRRMTQQFDHHHRNVESLSLDGMLHDPLPILPAQVRFDHVKLLSLGNMGLDGAVAYFLKHFKNAMFVNLADNKITRFPEVLSQMKQLEYVCLANNALQLTEHTRATLAGLRSLQVLNLSNNPLQDPPDVSRMFVMRELNLRNCRLKEFPKGVARLPYLENLDLRENDITTLPEWLLQVPRSYAQTVNLRHNPLDVPSQLLLRDYRRTHGVGMGYLEDDIARLTEQKARDLWLADDRVEGFAEKDRTWAGLRDEPGSDGLFNLLAELGGAADSSQVHEDMDRRVWTVLEAAAGDSELREGVFQRAATPLNCDDAAAVSFSALEVLTQIRQAEQLAATGQLTATPLLKLARGLFRLDQLERLAHNHSLEHPLADPLEVHLAFRTGLVDRFHLPGQPRHMRFASLGGVTASDLNEAEFQIKAAELSPRLLRYLVDLPFWQQYLKRRHSAGFEALNEPFDERMSAVFDQSLTLDDTDYREQMNAILQEQVAAENKELDRLTQEALKREDLGGCLMP